jgi:putative transposase
MTNYRRNFIPGGSYFFTVAIADRSSHLLVEHIDLLRHAFRSVKNEHPFEVTAVVILPDHLHCIWTLPPGDTDYPTRWKKIKAAFSHGLPMTESRSASRITKGERGIWQRRFWEHTLRDEADLQRHVDYIHYNPVKRGHATSAMAWPHSSFRKFVARGIYPVDWAVDPRETSEKFGERA